MKANEAGWVLALHSGCPPLLGMENPGFSCAQFSDQVATWLANNKVETVFPIASWNSYAKPNNGQYVLEDAHGRVGNEIVFPDSFRRTVQALRDTGAEIVVIGPTPGAPSEIMIRLAIVKQKGQLLPKPNSQDAFRADAKYFWRETLVYSTYPNITFIDPSVWLCNKSCRYLDEHGSALYRDGAHLSVHGAMVLGKNLGRILATTAAFTNTEKGQSNP